METEPGWGCGAAAEGSGGSWDREGSAAGLRGKAQTPRDGEEPAKQELVGAWTCRRLLGLTWHHRLTGLSLFRSCRIFGALLRSWPAAAPAAAPSSWQELLW